MRRRFAFGLIAAGCLAVTAMVAGVARAEDAAAKVKASMQLLKEETAKLGAAKAEGTEQVGDKNVPALFFGGNKINNTFTVVDDVVQKLGGTATLFVKSGDEYVRVSTNVKKPDGSRAIATILDPNGKAIQSIKAGQAFYGDVDILGKQYTTGYEPIRDAGGNVIGLYYTGYLKE